ncbi:DUF5643 domain-containing protein [Paenibacillus rhizoplanae]
MSPVQNKDAMILELVDLKKSGRKKFFSEKKFELTLNFTTPEMKEGFKLDIPVEINTENNLVLTPNISREYDGIDFKVDKIEFTPVTTNLTTQIKKIPKDKKISELYKSNRSIGYDMFDENGKIQKDLW